MNLDRTTVAALIPAHGEEARIGEVVRRARAQLDTVLVIDDGSPDATASRAREAGAEVVCHPTNRGKGAAIKTGLAELVRRGFAAAVILDGDGQHRPEEIPRFLREAVRGDVHLVIGNRMADTQRMPLVRRVANRLLSHVVSALCGQSIPDTQCGFRLVNLAIIPRLHCVGNAYDYESEMLLVAARQGLRIVSVPVSTIYGTEKSKVRPMKDTLRFLRLMVRFLSRRGKPEPPPPPRQSPE